MLHSQSSSLCIYSFSPSLFLLTLYVSPSTYMCALQWHKKATSSLSYALSFSLSLSPPLSLLRARYKGGEGQKTPTHQQTVFQLYTAQIYSRHATKLMFTGQECWSSGRRFDSNIRVFLHKRYRYVLTEDTVQKTWFCVKRRQKYPSACSIALQRVLRSQKIGQNII
jgi:hypothetical protein